MRNSIEHKYLVSAYLTKDADMRFTCFVLHSKVRRIMRLENLTSTQVSRKWDTLKRKYRVRFCISYELSALPAFVTFFAEHAPHSRGFSVSTSH